MLVGLRRSLASSCDVHLERAGGDIYVTNARGERRAAAAWVGDKGRARRLVGARVTDPIRATSFRLSRSLRAGARITSVFSLHGFDGVVPFGH